MKMEIDELPLLAQGEVTVIGAGPAGSATAAAVAAGGVSVILLDKKERIGLPVQCAEYVPANLKEEVPVPASCIAQKVAGFRTWIEGEQVAQTRAPGYILNRNRYDLFLAERAVQAGAKLLTQTRAVFVTGHSIVVEKQGRFSVVKAGIVIGAEGPVSVTARGMPCPDQALACARQMTVRLRASLEWARIYFSTMLPGGYGWLFPKKDLANVGVSLDRRLGGSLSRALEKFRQSLVKEGLIEEGVIQTTGGVIPVGGPRVFAHKNRMLVGDAAGHTHPISGEGIFPAIVSGKLAGRIAVDSIRACDIDLLERYPIQWALRFGKFIDRGLDKRNYYNKEWGKENLSSLVRKTWFAFPEYFNN